MVFLLQPASIFATTGNFFAAIAESEYSFSASLLSARYHRSRDRRTGATTGATRSCNRGRTLLHAHSRRETQEATSAATRTTGGESSDRRRGKQQERRAGGASRPGASLVHGGTIEAFFSDGSSVLKEKDI